jgi:ammonia channel protein AmtB
MKTLALLMTPRVDEEGEAIGLDLHQHGEKGYS